MFKKEEISQIMYFVKNGKRERYCCDDSYALGFENRTK
jgi:hypothetical protein